MGQKKEGFSEEEEEDMFGRRRQELAVKRLRWSKLRWCQLLRRLSLSLPRDVAPVDMDENLENYVYWSTQRFGFSSSSPGAKPSSQ